MERLRIKRSGGGTNRCTLAELDGAALFRSPLGVKGSNDSVKTLVSSEDMLTPEEASQLAPTNAPVMKISVDLGSMQRVRSV